MKYLNYFKILFQRFNEFILFKNLRQLQITELEFKRKVIKSKEYTPVFFLSTGRTGTEFFTQLLNKSNKVKVFHSPSSLFCNAQSELIEEGKIVYEMYGKYGFDDERVNKMASQILMASREKLLYMSYLHEKNYVETNNRISFFAPAIKAIFPNAKFVHLYRHPAEFIRSGIRRNYYLSESTHELGRLIPLESSMYYPLWNDFSQLEKISWLWMETNTFIDKYLETLNKNDYFKFNFNNLMKDNINDLLAFLEIDDICEEDFLQKINKPVNEQTTGSFPKYNDWIEEDKNKMIDICKNLSLQYGYEL